MMANSTGLPFSERSPHAVVSPPETGVRQQTDQLTTALAGRYRIERHRDQGAMVSVRTRKCAPNPARMFQRSRKLSRMVVKRG